jgi:nicotinate-nucleotide pyrophosphorylase (carboxylating)
VTTPSSQGASQEPVPGASSPGASSAAAPRAGPRAENESSATIALPPPRSGPPRPLETAEIDRYIRAALDEDRGGGDLTSFTAVPEKARARATLVAKGAGVLAGLPVFARTFEICDRRAKIELLAKDGAACQKGDVVARIEGSARALLLAERNALNFVQRLSGIATMTAKFVRLAREAVPAASGDSKVPRILDTRKTTPGLRLLEKYAVRCGGGENHRFGLYDEVMVKENHIELAGRSIEAVLEDLRRAVGPGIRITSEARDEREALAAVDGGADVVLLDNMTATELARLSPILRARALARGRRIELEASGGVDERTIGDIARAGVDRISMGALTHSAPALDLSLELEPAP